MEEKYTFVRIKQRHGNSYGSWYLKPKSVEQIDEHWHKVCAPYMVEGLDDFKKSFQTRDGKLYGSGIKHLTNWFASGVFDRITLFGGSYMEQSTILENQAYKARVDMFGKYDIYLSNGMPVFIMNPSCKIVETKESDELVYPEQTEWLMSDIRYMKWPEGTHWYAKISTYDVRDKDGNMKWNTKEEAESAAVWFVEQCNKKY